ncbi:DNA-directed DNA polymerase family B multifunctional domain, partial [Trinorchestia longiramus]
RPKSPLVSGVVASGSPGMTKRKSFASLRLCQSELLSPIKENQEFPSTLSTKEDESRRHHEIGLARNEFSAETASVNESISDTDGAKGTVVEALNNESDSSDDIINSSQPGSPLLDCPSIKLRIKKSSSNSSDIPLARSDTISLHRDTPLSRNDTPVSRNDTPVSRSETPVSRSETPVSRPETPVSRPETPVSRPETPVSRPETPISRSEAPISRSETPILCSDTHSRVETPHLYPASGGSSNLSMLRNSGTLTTPCARRLLMDPQFRRQYHLASQHSTSYRLGSSSLNGSLSHRADDTFGFRFQNHDLQTARALHQHQHVGSLCLEAHVCCRGRLLPDPRHDAVMAVVLLGVRDSPSDQQQHDLLKVVLAVGGCSRVGLPDDVTFVRVPSELQLLDQLVTVVRTWDPDILMGYEVQNSSWGYVLERCSALGGTDLVSQLSRVPHQDPGAQQSHHDPELDAYGATHTSHIHVAGRIVLNVWRVMKNEAALYSYTLQNVSHHLLHTRVPEYSYATLQKWWADQLSQHRVLNHYLQRASLSLQLFERLDLVNRTSELARLFGIEFYDVLARGTQYRVESMMLRLSRSHNFVALSPSVQQRAQMRAPEWIALNMEPQSRLYTDPVVVLDFQSLYPSIMIAHNYCFSTCLGRVELLTGPQPFAFGAGLLKVSIEELEEMVDELHISPCGVAFVPKRVRSGILPKMLEEILNTRIMVKQSMKLHKEDATLQKALHSRQLGLKLIANVTYGYTSANFSGRMPCVEVADSVVSKGRETLEMAIKLVNNHPTWGGTVVYGDTDSMFIHLPGKTKDQAFDIGQEIADTVTNMNPKPVKLKFEKVYLPCILQTKKRYVGYMYETRDQEEPQFEAKGIETVRRDGCPIVAKLLEQSLRIVFTHLDVSLVRKYLVRQFYKLLAGGISLQLLTFAKEYRGARGYRPGACVPALELARQRLRQDPRSEPLPGERVPYVIVYGAPGLPLIKLVRCPSELLSQAGSNLRPNYVYYITKAIIPPLDRCFSLLGVNVMKWYQSMPRPSGSVLADFLCAPQDAALGGRVSAVATISQYFSSVTCVICGASTVSKGPARPVSGEQNTEGVGPAALCCKCRGRPQATVLVLNERVRAAERAVEHINKICRACQGFGHERENCTSLDCPVLYSL